MPDLTIPEVADYLGRHLGAPVSITSLRKTFPGISRETWLVQAEFSGAPHGFVVRVDPPGGPSVPQPLRQEWEVYRRLWTSPVPVAEPLWFDEGGDFAQGRPLMVRRLVEGTTSPPGITDEGPGSGERRRRVVYEHIEKLALVHQLDWKAHGLDAVLAAPDGPHDALAAEFRMWKSIWEDGRTAPYPLITEALDWLEENLPTDTPRLSLVKGNNGIGEEIWRDDRIVAMSDWELASIGDGVIDLAFSQGTLELHDFDDAIAHYERCMGETVSPQRLAFAAFWIPFKVIVCLNVFRLRRFMAGQDQRISALTHGLLSTAGCEYRLSTGIGRDIVEAWRSGPRQNQSVYAALGDAK
jgi:aminoglycoside phosphotransferase (APT) family kinase protein